MKGIIEFKVSLFCCMMPNCSKSYSTKFNLKRHVEIYHLKQRKHYCQECDRFFVSQQNLREHSFIHSGTKPYKCNYCDECFRQISQLSIHRRNHEFQHLEKGNFYDMFEAGGDMINLQTQCIGLKIEQV